MLDADLLAIRRKRRQQKRCVACGASVPRAALCKVCRATLRYCPRCEAVYPLAETSQRDMSNGRSTAYCLPCGNVVRNKRGRPLAQYLAEQRQRTHPKLPAIIKLYRRGVRIRQIADELDINRNTLRALIDHARRTGRWPKHLSRGKGWRKGDHHATANASIRQ